MPTHEASFMKEPLDNSIESMRDWLGEEKFEIVQNIVRKYKFNKDLGIKNIIFFKITDIIYVTILDIVIVYKNNKAIFRIPFDRFH